LGRKNTLASFRRLFGERLKNKKSETIRGIKCQKQESRQRSL